MQLIQWFIYCLVVSLFAGYIASRTLPTGVEYLDVSQIVSTTAFLSYTMGRWADVVWYRKSASTALKYTFDGLLYGFATGGVFGWYWGTLVLSGGLKPAGYARINNQWRRDRRHAGRWSRRHHPRQRVQRWSR
jgi:hypothetical protein